MKIKKHDLPILAEFYNSLNSDRLYSRLAYFRLDTYIEELDDNHCIFAKDVLKKIDSDTLNNMMNKYQWYIAMDGERFIGYRPRFVKLKNTDILDYKFYHFSPSKYKTSILKNGLRPKAKNNMETYEPAVYLFSEYLCLKDDNEYNNVDTEIKYLINELREKSGIDEKYTIYEIQFKNKNIEILQDLTYDYGCYVHRVILPEEIKIVKEY